MVAIHSNLGLSVTDFRCIGVMKMVNPWVGQAIHYGVWSGPNYSASRFSYEYEAKGVARIFTAEDIARSGVDAYDNFVAKPHDLNEIIAERRLREALNALDPELASIDTRQETIAGSQETVYSERLIYGNNDTPHADGTRFVSYEYYVARAKQLGISSAGQTQVAKIFLNYYEHLIRSNAQFAVDWVRNPVDPLASGLDAVKMNALLLGASTLFSEEGITLNQKFEAIVRKHGSGSGVLNRAEIDQYLDGNFQFGEDFETSELSFIKSASKEFLIGATRFDLVRYASALAAGYAVGDLNFNRLLKEAIESGAIKSVEDLEEFVESLQGPGRDFCFLAGTMVSVESGEQAIESVRLGDMITAYDKDGNLHPARVSAVHINQADHILDVHGLMVTPGHHTLCGDGPYIDQHVPIIDILRTDGALVREDGTKVRAATGCELGTPDDQFVWAITGDTQPDSTTQVRHKGRIRLGTRVITPVGVDISVRELIEGAGGRITPAGLIIRQDGGPQMPFLWTFGDYLPKPEDYVLQRSGLTLMDLYDDTGHAVTDLSMRQ